MIKYPPTFIGASPTSIVIRGVVRLVRLIEHNLRAWYESAHDWLVRLAMDLPLWVICEPEHGTNCDVTWSSSVLTVVLSAT